jgi:hypothetical protein
VTRARAAALALVAAGTTTFALARRAHACAGCSNPNLLAGRSGVAALAPGEVSVALHATGTAMNVVHRADCPEIGPICEKRAEPPQLHDQDLVSLELRPIVAVGITDVFAVEAQLPLRILDTTIAFRRLDGTLYEPDYVNIHHRDEMLAGPGDPWLLGRFTGKAGPVTVSSRAGVALPLGSTVENPFRLADEGKEHQHIQFGAGMPAPVFALDASIPVGPVRASGYAQAVMFLARNGEGYQPGNRWGGGVAGDLEVASGLRLGAGIDLVNEQPERWDGRIQQDGNVGRTDVLVGGMASLLVDRVTTSLSVKVPVVQHFIEHEGPVAIDPGQLTYPVVIGLSATTTFGKPPAPAPTKPKSGVVPVR